MTPAAVLEEIRRRGAIAYRAGDTIRLRPASVLPPELIDAVRRHKAQLLELVGDRPPVPPVDSGDEIGASISALTAPGAWRLVIESCVPRPGPIVLEDGCTTITDPTRCIEVYVVELGRAIAHRNAGLDTCFAQLVDEYVERLRACGADVRVEVMQ